MASQEIAIDTGMLAGDIGELETALQNARKQLDDMFGKVKELDAMWDGPANEEFNRQFTGDYEMSKELCETVQSLIMCMQFAREQYDKCENDVDDIIASIRI